MLPSNTDIKMMKEKSVYLYDPQRKDLYQKVLNEFSRKDCVFGRNLLAYLEGPEDQVGPFYSKHLLTCPTCQAKARDYKKMMHSLDEAIPFVEASIETKEMFHSELKEILPLFEKVEEEDPMKGIFLESLKEFAANFYRSKEMAAGVALAAMTFFLIFLVQN